MPWFLMIEVEKEEKLCVLFQSSCVDVLIRAGRNDAHCGNTTILNGGRVAVLFVLVSKLCSP